MPRYYFDLKNGHRLIDPSGLDCRDDQEAIAKAVIIAQQIGLDAPGAVGGRHISVLDSERQEITAVPVHSDMNAIIMALPKRATASTR
jgi:alcohol dehydrogenase YqhD (iron-dependent ADH family)